MPEAVTHSGAKALVDGALHAALHRGADGAPPLIQQLYLQAVLPLADDCSGRGPFLDFGTPVSCQAVFPASVKNGTDAAGEA